MKVRNGGPVYGRCPCKRRPPTACALFRLALEWRDAGQGGIGPLADRRLHGWPSHCLAVRASSRSGGVRKGLGDDPVDDHEFRKSENAGGGIVPRW